MADYPGLLNYQPDPIAQGLLGFASGALTPVSRGGGIGAGLLGASQGMDQARQQYMQMLQFKRQQEMDDIQRQKLQQEMSLFPAHADLYRAQAETAKIAARKAQAELDQQDRIRQALANLAGANNPVGPPAPMGGSIMAGSGQQPMPQSMPAVGGRPSRMDAYTRQNKIADVYEQNGLFEQANKLRETATKSLPEINKIEPISDQSGKLRTRLWFKDGSFEDTDVSPFDPNKAFNTVQGVVQANKPLQAYEIGKTAAGATRVNIPINTEKTWAGKMADIVAGQNQAAIDAAHTAPAMAERAQRILSTLEKTPITGTFAEQRLGVSRALATAGIIDPKDAVATESLMRDLGGLTLDSVKSSGLGAGNGFTDKDLKFLERAKSGNIEMTPGNLREVARLSLLSAQQVYAKGSRITDYIRKDPALGSVSGNPYFSLPPMDQSGGLPSGSAIDAEIARRRGGR